MDTYDVAIVGAGPIGLELAVALKRRGVSYVQFDARQIGQTMSWWAAQTRFFSSNERIAIAGVPLVTVDGGKATREVYLAYLRGVVMQFGLEVRTYEPVTEVRRLEGCFELATTRRGVAERTRARRVVLATGGTDRPRRLGVVGEDLPHVSHYFREAHEYFGRRLMVVGGKNSAAEAALRCFHGGAEVLFSYRRKALPAKSIKYWILPELQGLLDANRIVPLMETEVASISESEVRLRHADGLERGHAADFVLLMTGYEADMSLFRLLGVPLAEGTQAPVFDVRTMETGVPGVYVAGTAAGGTQDRFELFIENCHVHVDRIVRHITGEGVNAGVNGGATYALPES